MDGKVVLFEKGAECTLYSIQFAGRDTTEFDEFLDCFDGDLERSKDMRIIATAVRRILNNGSLERYFRNEGKMKDRVSAMPIDKCALRLYCLRLSDSVLIVGGGGVKKTATYEEDDKLAGCVISLQNLDKQIRMFERKGEVSIEKGEIKGIDDKTFDL